MPCPSKRGQDSQPPSSDYEVQSPRVNRFQLQIETRWGCSLEELLPEKHVSTTAPSSYKTLRALAELADDTSRDEARLRLLEAIETRRGSRMLTIEDVQGALARLRRRGEDNEQDLSANRDSHGGQIQREQQQGQYKGNEQPIATNKRKRKESSRYNSELTKPQTARKKQRGSLKGTQKVQASSPASKTRKRTLKRKHPGWVYEDAETGEVDAQMTYRGLDHDNKDDTDSQATQSMGVNSDTEETMPELPPPPTPSTPNPLHAQDLRSTKLSQQSLCNRRDLDGLSTPSRPTQASSSRSGHTFIAGSTGLRHASHRIASTPIQVSPELGTNVSSPWSNSQLRKQQMRSMNRSRISEVRTPGAVSSVKNTPRPKAQMIIETPQQQRHEHNDHSTSEDDQTAARSLLSMSLVSNSPTNNSPASIEKSLRRAGQDTGSGSKQRAGIFHDRQRLDNGIAWALHFPSIGLAKHDLERTDVQVDSNPYSTALAGIERILDAVGPDGDRLRQELEVRRETHNAKCQELKREHECQEKSLREGKLRDVTKRFLESVRENRQATMNYRNHKAAYEAITQAINANHAIAFQNYFEECQTQIREKVRDLKKSAIKFQELSTDLEIFPKYLAFRRSHASSQSGLKAIYIATLEDEETLKNDAEAVRAYQDTRKRLGH